MVPWTRLGNAYIKKNTKVCWYHCHSWLILKYNITEVSFVLSLTNPIIHDALANQDFSDIRGLNNFYDKVLMQKRYSKVLYRAHNRDFTILSYHLNKKIKELLHVLQGSHTEELSIVGRIYCKQRKTFDKIYPDLVCTEYFSLN